MLLFKMEVSGVNPFPLIPTTHIFLFLFSVDKCQDIYFKRTCSMAGCNRGSEGEPPLPLSLILSPLTKSPIPNQSDLKSTPTFFSQGDGTSLPSPTSWVQDCTLHTFAFICAVHTHRSPFAPTHTYSLLPSSPGVGWLVYLPHHILIPDS